MIKMIPVLRRDRFLFFLLTQHGAHFLIFASTLGRNGPFFKTGYSSLRLLQKMKKFARVLRGDCYLFCFSPSAALFVSIFATPLAQNGWIQGSGEEGKW